MSRLFELLSDNDIEVVVDVRSSPYPRYHTQFDLPVLRESLAVNRIKYVHIPQLGGRPKARTFYDEDGHVLYARLAESPDFRDGLRRLLTGAEGYRVAVLCSEEDPVSCHRWRLIGRAVEEVGQAMEHLRGDGRIESHRDVLIRDEALHPERYQMQLIESADDQWRSTKPVDRAR